MSSATSPASSRQSSPMKISPTKKSFRSKSINNKIYGFLNSFHYIFLTSIISLAPIIKLATIRAHITCSKINTPFCIQCPENSICYFNNFTCIDGYKRFNNICVRYSEYYIYEQTYEEIQHSLNTNSKLKLKNIHRSELKTIIESNNEYKVDKDGDIHAISDPKLLLSLFSCICLFSVFQCIRIGVSLFV